MKRLLYFVFFSFFMQLPGLAVSAYVKLFDHESGYFMLVVNSDTSLYQKGSYEVFSDLNGKVGIRNINNYNNVITGNTFSYDRWLVESDTFSGNVTLKSAIASIIYTSPCGGSGSGGDLWEEQSSGNRLIPSARYHEIKLDADSCYLNDTALWNINYNASLTADTFSISQVCACVYPDGSEIYTQTDSALNVRYQDGQLFSYDYRTDPTADSTFFIISYDIDSIPAPMCGEDTAWIDTLYFSVKGSGNSQIFHASQKVGFLFTSLFGINPFIDGIPTAIITGDTAAGSWSATIKLVMSSLAPGVHDLGLTNISIMWTAAADTVLNEDAIFSIDEIKAWQSYVCPSQPRKWLYVDETGKVKSDTLPPGSAGSFEQVQADWNQSDTSQDDYIKNKPTIPANLDDLSNVNAGSPSINDILVYDGANWKNGDPHDYTTPEISPGKFLYGSTGASGQDTTIEIGQDEGFSFNIGHKSFLVGDYFPITKFNQYFQLDQENKYTRFNVPIGGFQILGNTGTINFSEFYTGGSNTEFYYSGKYTYLSDSITYKSVSGLDDAVQQQFWFLDADHAISENYVTIVDTSVSVSFVGYTGLNDTDQFALFIPGETLADSASGDTIHLRSLGRQYGRYGANMLYYFNCDIDDYHNFMHSPSVLIGQTSGARFEVQIGSINFDYVHDLINVTSSDSSYTAINFPIYGLGYNNPEGTNSYLQFNSRTGHTIGDVWYHKFQKRGDRLFDISQDYQTAYLGYNSPNGGNGNVGIGMNNFSKSIVFNHNYQFPYNHGSANQTLVDNGSGLLNWQTMPAVESGTISNPSITDITNADSVILQGTMKYQKIDSIVTFSGTIFIYPSAPGTVLFSIDCPVYSNFSDDYDANGTVQDQTNPADYFYFTAGSPGTISFSGSSSDASQHAINFIGQYEIK